MSRAHVDRNRRRLLAFLITSPLFAYLDLNGFASEIARDGAGASRPPEGDHVIRSPKEAINVFDFEGAARNTLPIAHYGNLVSGVDDELTLRANRRGFSKYALRPRRLVGVRNVDPSSQLFGVNWDTPLFLSPTGSNAAYHPDGEVAVARGARTGGHLMMVSCLASKPLEEIVKAYGRPIWSQLFLPPSLEIAKPLLKRAENAGTPVVVLTVDHLGKRNLETFKRLKEQDPRDCKTCHIPGQSIFQRKPMFSGLNLSGYESSGDLSLDLTWDFVGRLRDLTKMKIVLKGILTREDAAMCLHRGVDGIIVSNHGGRSEDNGYSTIESLTEVVQAVDGRIPVLMDGGVRRGTDIIKALALGARAVGIGRPYLFGLGAFGQSGVERVLEILREELREGLRQVGAPTIGELGPALVRKVDLPSE